MVEIKNFKNRKIEIREFSAKDLKRAKDFLDFINSLIKENAKIRANKKLTLKEEKQWLKNTFSEIKKKKKVVCVAEPEGKIVGISEVRMESQRRSHVGEFGITIRKEYRGIGFGKYLMGKVLNLAKEKLKQKYFVFQFLKTTKLLKTSIKNLASKRWLKFQNKFNTKEN
jgi:ribosomal protein S18 acetylase RimI-like enzyme